MPAKCYRVIRFWGIAANDSGEGLQLPFTRIVSSLKIISSSRVSVWRRFISETGKSKRPLQYQRLAAEYPDDLSTLLTLAHLYIAVSQYKLAIDTFSNAILMQPDNFSPENDEMYGIK